MLQFRILLMILGLPILLSVEGRAQSARKKLVSLADDYTTDGSRIIRRVGDYDFEKFLKKSDTAGILEGFGTVVHESCHQLNHLISVQNSDYNRHCLGYFITRDIDIVSEQGPVFNSTKLNKMVPDSLQNQILRYKTYVGVPQKYLISQEDGIFGLVDELDAYYHGTKACFELYDFYLKYRCQGYRNANEWSVYVQHVAGSYFAYYEFRLFISWYLEYAKLYEPDVYESCMQNTKLRLAYTLIDNLFGQLIQNINTTFEDLAAKLSTGNVKVQLADYDGERSFVILSRISATRSRTQAYSIFSNNINLLKGLLEGKQNAILDHFRISGATLDNYQSY